MIPRLFSASLHVPHFTLFSPQRSILPDPQTAFFFTASLLFLPFFNLMSRFTGFFPHKLCSFLSIELLFFMESILFCTTSPTYHFTSRHNTPPSFLTLKQFYRLSFSTLPTSHLTLSFPPSYRPLLLTPKTYSLWHHLTCLPLLQRVILHFLLLIKRYSPLRHTAQKRPRHATPSYTVTRHDLTQGRNTIFP